MFLSILWSLLLALFPISCSQIRDFSQKKILRMALFSDPQTLDPRRNRDISSSVAQNMIFEGLTRLLENGEIEYAQAERVVISSDGLTYRFYLRDAYWTDGHPVTAHDFERAWKTSLDPSFGSTSSFLLIPLLNASAILQGKLPPEKLGVRSIDEKTLEVKLSNPTPYFLSLVSLCPYFPIPTHIEEKSEGWEVDPDPRSFVSNGPFKLSLWKRQELFAVEKNRTYWDPLLVYLEEIQVFIIKNETTCLQMFEANEIDYLNSCFIQISLDYLKDFPNKQYLRIDPIGASVFCSFNLDHPHLQNKKIRQALSLAIDRESIVENILQMDEIPARRFVPPVLSPNPELQFFELFNPNLAKTLFEEGLAEQQITLQEIEDSFILSYENTERNRRIVQTIQHQWDQILGFRVKLLGYDDRLHLEKLERRDYCIGVDYWIAHYLDPCCILDRFKYRQSKKNYPGYENAQYIDLLNRAGETADPATRNLLLAKAEEIISSDLPLAPIFHFNVVTLQNNRFEPIRVNPLGGPVFKNIRPTP